MKYKALRRIADKQWIKPGSLQLIEECNYPVKMDESSLNWWVKNYPQENWLLYELVEVFCIAVEDLPSDEQVKSAVINNKMEAVKGTFEERELFGLGFYKGIKWYKSQIIKP